jgi:hypothetical protein
LLLNLHSAQNAFANNDGKGMLDVGALIMHGWHRLEDLLSLAAIFCLFAALIFYQRLISRLNIARRGQLLPRARGANVFELFREYRQVYGTNDLPQICTFWLFGFMILFSASLICGGWF